VSTQVPKEKLSGIAGMRYYTGQQMPFLSPN